MRHQNNILESPTEAEEHFRFFANLIPDIVWTALPDGYHEFYNERFTEYTGISPSEALGFGWQKAVHADDLDNLNKVWKDSLAQGKHYEVEYRLRQHSGEYRWFLVRAIPWTDENGDIIKWFGATTDIHYAKTIEENFRKIMEELTRSNNDLSRVNDILNHFVYIAAHDLRSPMNNLTMLFDLFKEEKDNTRKQELMEFIERSLSRLDRTVNGLMEVIKSANEDSKVQHLLFDDILHIVVSDLAITYPDISRHIVADFSNCPAIEYVKPYLISIIKNLVSNSYKYRSPERDLEVTVVSQKEGAMTKLIISDNGKGINMETAGDIFRPFKRLTNEGEGTGVGLYVVKNIIEKNGGSISVSSKEGAGTTFTIIFKEYGQHE